LEPNSLFSTAEYSPESFQEKRVTILGLGLFGGGRGAAEFFCRRGAYVRVTDLRSETELAPSIAELRGLPIRWTLGEHREEDIYGADLVVASPGIPRTSQWIVGCAARGIPLETEMNLFFKFCRGRVAAVTGSNGKTTTTSLLGALAAREFPSTRLGGNLGRSLLPEVDRIGEADWVVLELSSFQLEDMSGLDRRPEIAVVTNLSPNHLDRHGTYEAYIEAKREIIRPMGRSGRSPGVFILNAEDAVLRGWVPRTSRSTVYFGRSSNVTPRATGAWWTPTSGEISWCERGQRNVLFRSEDMLLRGDFNRVNAAAASAAAIRMGVRPETIRDVVREFRPVEHRLELVAEWNGVEFFNDSIATTPESTIVALEALGPRVLLICGGKNKGSSFDALARAICRHAKCVFLIGSSADSIREALDRQRHAPPIDVSERLDIAVESALALASPGDRVVLSPACASYDQFLNFEERGRKFKEQIRAILDEHTH
jgi:UDP-N-acetylmuramoylalanine--D-glutamate ligase